MTILITPAKIGRSIKKCGKFMAIARALRPRSFSGWRWSGARFCVRPAGGRLLGYWRNFHSGLQQLQTRGDNSLAVLQPALHDPLALEHRAGLKRPALN